MTKSSSDRRVAKIVPFGLRMQPELKQQIEAFAYENGRSLNAEIVWRLEKSLLTAASGNRLSFAKKIKGTPMPQNETDRLERIEAELVALKKQVEELLVARQRPSEP